MKNICFDMVDRFRWKVFFPFLLLFFSYVFGVAVDQLGDFQLFIRLFVILVVVFYLLKSNPKFSNEKLLVFSLLLFYFILFYFISRNQLVLNFIYMAIIIFYLSIMKITKEDVLFNSLVASFFVVLTYVVYFFIWSLDIGMQDIGGRVRYSFGFSNPNKVGIVAYSMIVLGSIYCLKRGGGYIQVILYTSPFLLIMFFSDSRTAIYSLVMFYVFTLTSVSIRFRRLLPIIPFVLLFLSFCMAVLHESEVSNNIFSLRPIDYYNFLSEVNILGYLFGVNTSEFRVDNSYLLAYFSVGPIGFLVIVYLLYCAGKYKCDKYELSFILSFLAYGFLEGVLVRVEFPIVIYFYYLLMSSNGYASKNVVKKGFRRVYQLNNIN